MSWWLCIFFSLALACVHETPQLRTSSPRYVIATRCRGRHGYIVEITEHGCGTTCGRSVFEVAACHANNRSMSAVITSGSPTDSTYRVELPAVWHTGNVTVTLLLEDSSAMPYYTGSNYSVIPMPRMQQRLASFSPGADYLTRANQKLCTLKNYKRMRGFWHDLVWHSYHCAIPGLDALVQHVQNVSLNCVSNGKSQNTSQGTCIRCMYLLGDSNTRSMFWHICRNFNATIINHDNATDRHATSMYCTVRVGHVNISVQYTTWWIDLATVNQTLGQLRLRTLHLLRVSCTLFLNIGSHSPTMSVPYFLSRLDALGDDVLSSLRLHSIDHVLLSSTLPVAQNMIPAKFGNQAIVRNNWRVLLKHRATSNASWIRNNVSFLDLFHLAVPTSLSGQQSDAVHFYKTQELYQAMSRVVLHAALMIN